MLLFRKVIPAIFFFVVGITFYSCYYDNADIQPCNVSVPATVSFNNDVLPFFRVQCSTSGCHSGSNPGGHLNLDDANAYTELSKSGSGYINTANPTHSILYSQMNSTSKPMPPAGKLDECSINLILKWIKQGAKNN